MSSWKDVELEVLHGRVEDLFHHRRKPVDLVDEQHVAGLEIGEQCGEVAAALDGGTTRGAQRCSHLAGDHVGQGGLAQAGRSVEEQVIEGLAPLARRPDEHREVLAEAILPHHLVQAAGTEALLEALLIGKRHALELTPGRASCGHLVHRTNLLSEARTRLSSVASEPASSAASVSTRSASPRE
jgi:hypothetical protein